METVQRRVFSQKKKTFRNEGDSPVHTQSWGAMSGNLVGTPRRYPCLRPRVSAEPGGPGLTSNQAAQATPLTHQAGARGA